MHELYEIGNSFGLPRNTFSKNLNQGYNKFKCLIRKYKFLKLTPGCVWAGNIPFCDTKDE